MKKLFSRRDAYELARMRVCTYASALTALLIAVSALPLVDRWNAWTVFYFVAMATAAVGLLVALEADRELARRQHSDRNPQTVVFTFAFLTNRRVIDKFVDDLKEAAKIELYGMKFRWNWQTMSLQCELPSSYRGISEGVITEGLEGFIRARRPLTARPMRRR